MKRLKKYILLLLTSLFTVSLQAQTDTVEMADTMRSNGKIYIVVAICLTILAGLFFYVFILDRKISKLEKSSRD